MPATKVCTLHSSLRVERVLDADIHWAEAILVCDQCGAYLYAQKIEEGEKQTRRYEVTALDSQAAIKTLRSVDQGSCDLSRASAEIVHLVLSGTRLAETLMVDANNNQSWQV